MTVPDTGQKAPIHPSGAVRRLLAAAALAAGIFAAPGPAFAVESNDAPDAKAAPSIATKADAAEDHDIAARKPPQVGEDFYRVTIHNPCFRSSSLT